ncbi:hypothetical protein IMCC3317_19400 [Kordia antarctica]|uniref:DUF2933 domain-containing protein n=1 Tax=Kordia antarctica TaxID=1218801 RepID=A0A7L4ZJC0_9FLAO|nr:hypothetical protein [Kordia antarctica]QHI36577.1 hypothetical protein IMCC3317_19400 [Kordia antarctica]
MKKNHWIWMIIGCGLPLLFIFLAPSFGMGSGSSLFTFIIIMFAIHLFMPHGSHGHDGHKHDNQNKSAERPIEKHKGHQHH